MTGPQRRPSVTREQALIFEYAPHDLLLRRGF